METLDALQSAYWLIDMLQVCIIRKWFCMWKDSIDKKALVISRSLIECSVTARMLDLVENEGLTLGTAAYCLMEEGVAEYKTLLEICDQIRMHRRK